MTSSAAGSVMMTVRSRSSERPGSAAAEAKVGLVGRLFRCGTNSSSDGWVSLGDFRFFLKSRISF